MGKIKIHIDVEDKEYGWLLAKRLSELSTQLEICIADINDSRECVEGEGDIDSLTWVPSYFHKMGELNVFITDREVMNGNKEDVTIQVKPDRDLAHCIISNRSDNKDKIIFYQYAPAKLILNFIISRYEEKTGIPFGKSTDKKIKIYGFYSMSGGSGTTSVALSFARLLSANETENTIFLTRFDDLMMYQNFTVFPLKSSFQFQYNTTRNRVISFKEYIYEDKFGLNYFISPIPENEIIRKIEKHSNYKHVVVDFGKNIPPVQCNHTFCVMSWDDKRTELVKVDNQHKLVINKSIESKGFPEKYLIPLDSKSFKIKNGKIDISLDMAFGGTLRKIVEDIRHE